MKQIKIGAITIGQAPRTDITRDILPLLPDYMTLTEYGALDDMTYEEVKMCIRDRLPCAAGSMYGRMLIYRNRIRR